jgi:hypothetical protein
MTARRVCWCQQANGPLMARNAENYIAEAGAQTRVMPVTCIDINRAGDGNRTRMTSLEGWSSTIELRPQQPPNHRLTPVAYRLPPHRRDSRAPRGGPSGIVAVTGQRE